MNRMIAATALLAAALAGGTASADEPAHRPDQTARGDAAVGEALAKRWCSQCHLIGGASKATDAAPPFAVLARNAANTPEHLRTLLGKQHAAMPQIPLSGTEADDLIAYIVRLGR